MAHSVVTLQHPITQDLREAPVGFSWTCLFLGFLLFAYRQDWWLAWVSLMVTFLVGPLPNILLCFTYNEWYLNRLLKQGYHTLHVTEL